VLSARIGAIAGPMGRFADLSQVPSDDPSFARRWQSVASWRVSSASTALPSAFDSASGRSTSRMAKGDKDARRTGQVLISIVESAPVFYGSEHRVE
jgi:hypothetical protein